MAQDVKLLGAFKQYPEFQRSLMVAQGWDIDWTYYFQSLEDREKDGNYTPTPEYCWKINIAKKSNEGKYGNALSQLCQKIKPGDLIVAYQGKKQCLGVCEIPTDFTFVHWEKDFQNNPINEYRNGLFPAKWIDWVNIQKTTHSTYVPPEVRTQGYGIQGIQDWNEVKWTQEDANKVKELWEDYKKKANFDPNAFPDEVKKILAEAKKTLSQRQKESYKSIWRNTPMIKNLTNLVTTAYNVILTGAPGTGKTHLAKRIANELTDNHPERIAVTQFHPSYDYTDFIEGLRPCYKANATDKTNADIGFELQKGIFMDFCDKAASDPNPDNNKYVFIIDEINRGEISKIFGEAFAAIDPGYRGKGKALPIKTQYANLHQTAKFQDSNFKNIFYVPENVYIIGTMNDIDRSVESFDFALRRRFAWYPVPAKGQEEAWAAEVLKDCKINNKLKEQAIKCMTALNKALHDDPEPKFADIYDIGPAYFRKLESYSNEPKPFDHLWTNHLEPVLNEYLREYPQDIQAAKMKILNEVCQNAQKEYEASNKAADNAPQPAPGNTAPETGVNQSEQN